VEREGHIGGQGSVDLSQLGGGLHQDTEEKVGQCKEWNLRFESWGDVVIQGSENLTK